MPKLRIIRSMEQVIQARLRRIPQGFTVVDVAQIAGCSRQQAYVFLKKWTAEGKILLTRYKQNSGKRALRAYEFVDMLDVELPPQSA